MSSNPFFLISLLISAIIAFSTVAIAVEITLAFLKNRLNGRTRSILRSLPFISLLTDLLSSSFSFSYLFNPLNCSSCIQKLILAVWFPDTKNYLDANEISLLRYLGEGIPHAGLYAIGAIGLATITIILLIKKAHQLYLTSQLLTELEKRSRLCCRPIENDLLSNAMMKEGIKVYVSPIIDSPLAAHSKLIFIPCVIEETFSQQEFEAVLAHEVEHIRWKDSQVRLLLQLIATLFWWVPTYSWRKRLEFDQEVACDQSVSRYGLPHTSLASALVKVCTKAKEKADQQLCYLTEKKHDSLRRLEAMLSSNDTTTKRFEWISFILVISFSIVTFLCALT